MLILIIFTTTGWMNGGDVSIRFMGLGATLSLLMSLISGREVPVEGSGAGNN